MDPIDFSAIRNVLVAKLRHQGDVLFTSPIFSLLKNRFPHLKIDAYLYEETAPMLVGHPAISQYLLYDRNWKDLPRYQRYAKELQLLRKIRKGKYDLVINLTEGDRGAIAAKISGCRYAVGFDPEGTGMMGKKSCYTHIVKNAKCPRHSVERQLDALRCIGLFPEANERHLFFHIPIEEQKKAEEKLERAGIQTGEYIAIHPVSRWMFKALPPQKIAQVIRFLHKRGESIVLTASSNPEEMQRNAEICALLPTLPICDLSGKTSLKELGAIIAQSRLLISVDSVSLHLASASRTPVVAIFGPSCEKNWGPYLHPQSRIVARPLPCRPCKLTGCGGSGKSDCLQELSSEEITSAISDLLEELPPPIEYYSSKSSPK